MNRTRGLRNGDETNSPLRGGKLFVSHGGRADDYSVRHRRGEGAFCTFGVCGRVDASGNSSGIVFRNTDIY